MALSAALYLILASALFLSKFHCIFVAGPGNRHYFLPSESLRCFEMDKQTCVMGLVHTSWQDRSEGEEGWAKATETCQGGAKCFFANIPDPLEPNFPVEEEEQTNPAPATLPPESEGAPATGAVHEPELFRELARQTETDVLA